MGKVRKGGGEGGRESMKLIPGAEVARGKGVKRKYIRKQTETTGERPQFRSRDIREFLGRDRTPVSGNSNLVKLRPKT